MSETHSKPRGESALLEELERDLKPFSLSLGTRREPAAERAGQPSLSRASGQNLDTADDPEPDAAADPEAHRRWRERTKKRRQRAASKVQVSVPAPVEPEPVPAAGSGLTPDDWAGWLKVTIASGLTPTQLEIEVPATELAVELARCWRNQNAMTAKDHEQYGRLLQVVAARRGGTGDAH